MCPLSSFSHVRLFATLWTVAHQAPLSMGFSRQGYWSGLPCPPPRDLPNPGNGPIFLISPVLAVSLLLAPPRKPNAHKRKKNQISLKFLIVSALLALYWYVAAFCLIHSATKLTTHLGLNVSTPSEKDFTCFSNKEHNLPCPHYTGSTVPDVFLHHGIC